jgi:adenosine deaminase
MATQQQTDPDRLTLLHRLPKVALHRHLEGSLRLETLLEVNQTEGLNLPARTVDEMRGLVTMANQRGTFRNYLQKFKVLRLFYRSPELIDRFAYEAVADAAADHIRYFELRFNPRALSQDCDFGFEEVTGWVCDAVARASADHDIITRLLLTMNRHESLEIGESIAQAAVDFKGRGVVGLDLAGNEREFPIRPFGPIFVQAKQDGLNITVHAGEWTGADTVRYAIENLYADRVGHGVRVIEDSAVARLARERGIVFEVCPTSNLQSGVVREATQHPLRDMFSLNLTTTVNTDNTCVSDITLTQEIDHAVENLGFSLRDVKQLTLNAARAAFLPEAERQALVAGFESALAEFPDDF